jgi:hypothetical protein
MRHRRISRTAALALALVAFGAPIAAAQEDLRSPDARDAARAATASKQDPRGREAATLRAQQRHDTSSGALDDQQRYLTAYGAREPLSRPQSPAAADHTPLIALSIAAAVAIVAASLTRFRRVRIRRRRLVKSTV